MALETFWGGLALAVLTALVWLAYTHPKSYERLYIPFAAIPLVALIVLGAFHLGHQLGWQGAEGGKPWKEPFSSGWAIGGLVGLSALNFLLVYMHQILGLVGTKDANGDTNKD